MPPFDKVINFLDKGIASQAKLDKILGVLFRHRSSYRAQLP